jgi:glycosyltransferase involved in cell wall biosynthesis
MTRQRVALLTADLIGPIRNGGIGTAFLSLAELLRDEGHDVTILYPSAHSETLPISYWVDRYAERGLRLETLFCEGDEKRHAYEAYRWLKPRAFDVIHFHDWRGIGYWLTVAKRCGLAFRDTLLICQAHGQTLWHIEHSGGFLASLRDLETDWLERRSVEGADLLHAPSAYMIRWMQGRGWRLPERRWVRPNLLPACFATAPAHSAAPLSEPVFFGRLETRKGLELFCQAISRLVASGRPPPRVSFIGKLGEVSGQPALAYLAEATAEWPMPWEIRNDLDVEGARRHLSAPGRFAVIASSIENSPYTVLECLAAGTAFLAADVGGTAELIAEADRGRVLFRREVSALAGAMDAALRDGLAPAAPAIAIAENRRAWAAWHAALKPPPAPAVLSGRPLVSVCIASFDRPALLSHAIASIEAQSWPEIELVLLDDASPPGPARDYLDALEPRFAARGWRILRTETELWTGAARNRAAAAAGGDFLLLLDDDNAAFPDAIETFVRAQAACGADILTAQQQPFAGPGAPPRERATRPEGWMPIGPNLSQAVFENCLGDLFMFVRRACWEALGGFSEERAGCEDWEFLLRAGLAGHRLECLPEILQAYRVEAGGLGQRYDRLELAQSFTRAARPAVAAVPEALAMAIRLASGRAFAEQARSGAGYWRGPPPDPRFAGLPPNSAAAFVMAARALAAHGRGAAARALAEQALRLEPGDEAAKTLLGALR